MKLQVKHIVFISLFLTTSYSISAQKKDNRLSGLDTAVNQILREWNVPGVSIAVVEKNKVLFTGGFGFRDYENKLPVTENTRFAIGSCTKSFTASLISYLVKEANLDLDAPVSDYFPELRFFNPEMTANVTVRDMLCHRTGLPRHDYAWYSGAMGSRDSMVKLMRYLEPSAPLRQTFQYNNLNYVVLGRLMEKMYQKSWEQLVEERLFSPLAMKNSATGLMGNTADYSSGYILKNGKIKKLDFIPASLSGIAPAGGITSTAKDMANWLLMWTNQGKFEGKEIIGQDFYKQAISSQMIASANLPSAVVPDYFFFNYGLGWYTANYRGHYGVGHGGNINGFSSFVSFFPTDSIGVFVSVNQNNSHVPRILLNIINDKMIGAPNRDWNAIIKKQIISTNVSADDVVKGAASSQIFPAIAGTYKNEAYGTIVINEEKNVLSGTFNRWNLKVKHLHHNYFKFTIDADVFDDTETFEGAFSITAKGDVGSLKIPFESTVQPIEFKKQHIIQTNPDELKKYAGEYSFSGLTAKIYLTENNILKALVPGQPEYELVPVTPNEFEVKGAKGVSIIFEQDEKGNVPACVFVQPNGKFRVTRINNTKVENKQSAIETGNFKKYAGEYNLGGQTVKIFIDADKLKAIIPGQPEYELIQVKNDKFSIKGIKNYSVEFERNDSADIIGFTMQQPKGSVRADKKD